VKGWVHPPRKGCPPPKKEKEVKRGKKKKGRQKARKNTGKEAYSRTAHNVPSIFLECAECSRVNIKNLHIPGIFLEYFEKLYKAE